MSFTPDFRGLISDIKAQPDWRSLATRCVDYYDHKQLTREQINKMRELGMPDITENLIHPAINSMLGNEAQRRQDWMVAPDDDDSQEVAEALNAKLNECMRIAEANSRCSEAYASQIKSGIGWLGVSRSENPFEADYHIEYVHRDEISYDMRGRAANLSDARWVSRRRFLDKDEAKAFLPKKHWPLVDLVAGKWQNIADHWEFAQECGSDKMDAMLSEWESNSANIEYVLDTERERVPVYEVYYREFKSVIVISFADGMKEEYKRGDQRQAEALTTGQATAARATIKKMRRRWFLGPHKIVDEPSPYPHDKFPYVPFFGYREEDTNMPYGVVRSMIDSQDAYNNCIIRIHHILNTKRIIASEDATEMTADQVQEEASRKDGYITLKNGKTYNRDMYIEQDWNELHKLIALSEKHEQKVRDCSGIYQAFSGKAQGDQSGVAIASLAELGAVTLAEVNDNYAYGRKQVAELMLAFIVHDIGDKETQVNAKQEASQNRKKIVLNRRMETMQSGAGDVDEGANSNNIVSMAKYQVALTSVHASPGYRQHTYMRLMEMYQQSGDFEKSILFPMIIESSEMPKKDEFLKKYNDAKGIIDDPEQAKAKQEAEAAKMQEAEAMAKAAATADIRLTNAQAAEREAQADLDAAKAAAEITRVEREREEARALERARKDEMLLRAREALAA